MEHFFRDQLKRMVRLELEFLEETSDNYWMKHRRCVSEIMEKHHPCFSSLSRLVLLAK